MSRRPKKRTKRYSGEDAKQTTPAASAEPVVHRYEAVERSRAGDWWQERKRTVRIGAIVIAVLGSASWLVFELVRIVL